ncbi:hypothetical protein [Burkholderia vietnamiensis]|uniref:hypothetical protein n=1 Tax=Burkholderia vietnamiensis TaxID=60552 RepID=UPI001D15E199|nr:hypothetical protein [Burkholderia vietnamiensis]UEC01659.1 hypothetical protein LK462_06435 [Burkholderia vietnamiensis]
MTPYMTAMASALAMRQICQRQVDKQRSLDHLGIDAIVTRVLRDTAALLTCSDEVFQGMAKAIQAQSHCTEAEAFEQVLHLLDPIRSFSYTKWRHGGWYVSGVRYLSGGCGCVSNNYPDKKWRIVCDNRRQALNEPGDVTFRSREEAARAEQVLALESWVAEVGSQA